MDISSCSGGSFKTIYIRVEGLGFGGVGIWGFGFRVPVNHKVGLVT